MMADRRTSGSSDEVYEAGIESFPASDPPSWTLGPPDQTESQREHHMPTIERTLAGESLHFHLPDELKAAENADIMARSGRTARTLVKDAMLRVTVHLLAPGGTIAQHHADGPITVHVLQGSITFSAGERDYELRAGDLLALEPSVQHSVSSKDGGAFLLTAALMPSSR